MSVDDSRTLTLATITNDNTNNTHHPQFNQRPEMAHTKNRIWDGESKTEGEPMKEHRETKSDLVHEDADRTMHVET